MSILIMAKYICVLICQFKYPFIFISIFFFRFFLLISFFIISLLFVFSISIHRDHPTTVKKRFFSVFMVMLISPIFIYVLLLANGNQSIGITIWEIMGFRMKGIFVAIFVPLLLTATLFLGPICAIIINGVWKSYLEPVYWLDCFKNILWIRNHIVAPLSEEFTFRACMMPLLLQSYRPTTAVLLTPLFFGVAHLHHNIERVRSGMDWKTALIVSSKFHHYSFVTKHVDSIRI